LFGGLFSFTGSTQEVKLSILGDCNSIIDKGDGSGMLPTTSDVGALMLAFGNGMGFSTGDQCLPQSLQK